MTAGLALTLGLSDPIRPRMGSRRRDRLVPCRAASRGLRHRSSSSTPRSEVQARPQPAPDVVRLLAAPGATPVALSTLLFPPTPAGLQARVSWQSSLFTGTTDWLTDATIKAEAALQASVWKRSDLAAGLSAVTIPALVVTGADDVIFPRANANLLAVQLLHTTLVVFPGSGYDAITQEEPAFVTVLRSSPGSLSPRSCSLAFPLMPCLI